MTELEEILMLSGMGWSGPSPEMDPLREVDVLQEAQLLDVRVHAVASTVALLFELRTALHFEGVNTALLVARGVVEFSWSSELRSTSRTAWNIVGSIPQNNAEAFSLSFECIPNAVVRLVAQGAEFYAGNVISLSPNPPDYAEDDATAIRANLPNWGSDFLPVYGSFLGPV